MSEIIVTIGPNSIDPKKLHSLVTAGATSFRINLSHSSEKSLSHYFDNICSCGITPAVDTQGAQLRVEALPVSSKFQTGERLRLCFGSNNSEGSDNNSLKQITFNHPEVASQVQIDDVLKIDFDGLLVALRCQESKYTWIGEVIAAGSVLLNRAVDIQGRQVSLEPLTDFDVYAVDYAQNRGCTEVYASFVSSGQDAKLIRTHLKPNTLLISKIETALGVANAIDIIEHSDAILIDRGDLSREISIASIPMAVRSLVQLAISRSCPVYVATNVLDSMMSSKLPSRAEVSDIYTLLASGVSGLVLAAEVAIGNNPVSSTALINYLSRLYQNHRDGLYGVSLVEKPSVELIGEQLYNWL